MTHGKWQLVPDRRTGTVTPCINHVITVQVSHQDDTVEIRGDTAPKVVKRSRIGTRVRVRMMQTSAVSILHTPSWGGGRTASFGEISGVWERSPRSWKLFVSQVFDFCADLDV